MTRQTFTDRLIDLRQEVLRLGALVEQALLRAMRALAEQDAALARQVIAGDDRIDAMAMELEADCLALIALQQPMASDLRLLGASLKMVTDLERMADHATDIARIAGQGADQPLRGPLVDLPRMAEITRTMLQEALQAYMHGNAGLARRMVERDHAVDALYKQTLLELVRHMALDPAVVPRATALLMVAQHLERAADHATNLGEWTIYLATGDRPELND